tara:strand:- start:203 stop:1825 length:1623 start_codon:yes stop_codon:yes gene_type:complete
MADITGIYNTSAFDGTLASDFISTTDLTPQVKADKVDYTSNDFLEYRESLLTYLKAVYPLDYNNFVESDLGMMVVETFSYLASVLSLKADLLANESYLNSVQSPQNLRKLLQLIGVSLKGPTSAKASCELRLPAGNELAGSETYTIAQANRTFHVASNRDTGRASFTLYEVNSNGKVDLDAQDLVLQRTESLNSSGASFSQLILLEGRMKTATGTFATNNTIHTISIPDSSIIEGSISVKTGSGDIYDEIENLFLADASSQVFSKTYADDYSATLVFGDDVRGKSPIPADTYTVTYRVGGGTRGNISPSSLSVSIPGTHSADGTIQATVVNSTKATGGSNSETVAHAKQWAPYFFKTQYRAVTGEDYTAFANRFVSTVGSTGKATATLRNSGAGSNMIDIYLVAYASEVDGQKTQLERASISFKHELLDYLNLYKMLTDEVTIVDGLIRTLDLKATLYVDKSYKAYEEDIKRTAATKILSFFDISARDFGERLRVDELNRVLFEIPEIRFSSLDNLTKDIKLEKNEILQLNNVEFAVEYV